MKNKYPHAVKPLNEQDVETNSKLKVFKGEEGNEIPILEEWTKTLMNYREKTVFTQKLQEELESSLGKAYESLSPTSKLKSFLKKISKYVKSRFDKSNKLLKIKVIVTDPLYPRAHEAYILNYKIGKNIFIRNSETIINGFLQPIKIAYYDSKEFNFVKLENHFDIDDEFIYLEGHVIKKN